MSIKGLLDFIGKYESRGDYNIVYGGIKGQHRPPKRLTTMTIHEVLAWQDGIDPLYPSEAAGKYQIMEDTLRGLYRQAGLTGDELFDERTQDFLATQLLRRRGLSDYLSGKTKAEKFANSIAKEWASMPVVVDMKGARRQLIAGQSYYAGDGLNKAHASVHGFMHAVRAVRDTPPRMEPPKPDYAPEPPASKPSPSGSVWANLLAALTRLFGGKR